MFFFMCCFQDRFDEEGDLPQANNTTVKVSVSTGSFVMVCPHGQLVNQVRRIYGLWLNETHPELTHCG